MSLQAVSCSYGGSRGCLAVLAGCTGSVPTNVRLSLSLQLLKAGPTCIHTDNTFTYVISYGPEWVLSICTLGHSIGIVHILGALRYAGMLVVIGLALPVRSFASQPRDSSWGSTSGSFLGSEPMWPQTSNPPMYLLEGLLVCIRCIIR